MVSYQSFYPWTEEFKTLLRYSDSRQSLVRAIVDTMPTHIYSCRRYCDVGCGDGEITYELIHTNLFDRLEEIVFVEPETELLNIAETRVRECFGGRITAIAEHFNEAVGHVGFGSGFSFIVMSHLIYYLDDIGEALATLYSALEIGGRLCVVARLEASDTHKIRRLFREHTNDIQYSPIAVLRAQDIIGENGWSFETQDVHSTIKIPSADVELFLRYGHKVQLVGNITAQILRICGHADSLMVPESLKDRIGEFFLSRFLDNYVCLNLVDRVIWISKE